MSEFMLMIMEFMLYPKFLFLKRKYRLLRKNVFKIMEQ